VPRLRIANSRTLAVYSPVDAGVSAGGGGSVGDGAGVDSVEGGGSGSGSGLGASGAALLGFAVVVADFFGVGGVTSGKSSHDVQPRTMPTVATAYSNFAMRKKYRQPRGHWNGGPSEALSGRAGGRALTQYVR
jgi:hypothetical protein